VGTPGRAGTRRDAARRRRGIESDVENGGERDRDDRESRREVRARGENG